MQTRKLRAAKFQPHLSPGKVPYKDTGRNNAYINEGKRRQLEAILDNEKTKEERGRLGCILIDRLVRKFGSKHSGLITFFVEEFLTSRAEIGKDDISGLEREIASTLQMKNNSRPNSTAPPNPEVSEGAEGSSSAKAQIPAASMAASAPGSGSAGGVDAAPSSLSRPPSGAEWQLLNSYEIVLAEEKAQKEKEAARAKKLNFRKSLDDHLNIAARHKNSENNEDSDYVQRIVEDISKYNNEEKTKFERIHQKNLEEARLRQVQIQEKQKRANREREEALENDRINQEMNMQKMKEETERTARIRKEKLDNMERIKAENRENERLRQLQKEKDAEEDQALMRAYAAKLDREAIERDNAFQKRMENSALHGQKFATEGAGKAIKEAAIRTEQLLLKEQQRKEAADTEKERKKEEDRRLRTKMQLMENGSQIEKRRMEEIEQVKADLIFKEKARLAAEEMKRQEEEKREAYHKKQAQYRAMLDKQVQEGRKNTMLMNGMSPVEKGINMPTIRDVTEDQQMLSRVMHRMRMGSASTTGRSTARKSTAPY
eukprot:CAMPEP_0174982560 /NCGR_PEP_ID=MMETSP0004_2-20121128/16582_1 /TAXON_ID=420556 /ORGANISM="Ochromonas sp., Strain CCMP1393" /LENGTH=544 /DNA_ID=CAMNT_0016234567 /DNA_START=27 /DNA_END=1661 /DNA_ORIENTATION=-